MITSETTLETNPTSDNIFTHAGNALRSAWRPSSGNANNATYAIA